VSPAATPIKLSGAVAGSVHDPSGTPQMGAVVELYNHHEKLVEKTITNAGGNFLFASLLPDVYSLHVSVANFVPAIKRNIVVQPGMQSVLAVNLATIFSSVELVYSSRNPGTLMSNDWQWVLRSTMTSRPVTRLLPGFGTGDSGSDQTVTAVFSDTRGLLKVSTGESSSPFASLGNQPDLGTTFALATSLYGRNQVQFAGNFGYGLASELPAAGFRTSFSRADAGPEIKLKVQQVGLATGHGMGPGTSNTPPLRTMSLTMIERFTLADGIDLDYGASMDSVTYIDRLNYLSPFARLTAKVGPGTLDIGYSSGAPPVDLLNAREVDGSLLGDVAALSLLPQVSLRSGHAFVQRSENFEAGYRLQIGSRTYSVGAYHEFVRNAALTMSAPDSTYFASGDLLPEISSRSSVFNIGNFSRAGYTASVTQNVGENFVATIAVGRGGVLTTAGGQLISDDPEELRRMIHRVQRDWARGIISTTLPATGTKILASYEWSDANALTPSHVFLTQKIYPDTGLNFRIRQPIPGWGGLPGRLEATAELRNLLSQGYLSVTNADGRRMLLSNCPRGIRGGLAFIF